MGEGENVPPHGASLQTGSKQDSVSSPASFSTATADTEGSASELSFLGFFFLVITHFFKRSSFPNVKAVLPHILALVILITPRPRGSSNG